MKSSAIRNLADYYTPILMVIPQISSHIDILLDRVVPEFFAQHQAIFNDSKIIKISQTESNISIEGVRKLLETLAYGSLNGELQAVVLPNIDLASIPAQNALLKVLEEPPAHIQFFLSTAAPDAVLETVRSRCSIAYFTSDIQNNEIDAESTTNPADILDKIGKNSIRENIELAETYQNKQEAINILTTMLNFLHQKMSSDSGGTTGRVITEHYTTACKAIITTVAMLQQNVNVKLALVECFIQLNALQKAAGGRGDESSFSSSF